MRLTQLGETPIAAGFAAMALSLVTSCASQHGRVPTDRIAQSEASIRSAEEAGANTKNPSAALHLRTAQEQAAQARRLIQEGQNRQAEMMLIRAAVDADLARALAMQVASQDDAQKAQQRLRALQAQGQSGAPAESTGTTGGGQSPTNPPTAAPGDQSAQPGAQPGRSPERTPDISPQRDNEPHREQPDGQNQR